MSRFDDDLRHAAGRLAAEPLPSDILDEALDEAPRRRTWPAVAAVAVLAAAVVIAAGTATREVASDPSPTPSLDGSPEPTATVAPHSATPQPSPSPSASRPPARPITASVEDEGIRLTVTLDRDRSTFGQRVMATATIENIGTDSVFWGHSSSCVYPASIQVRPDDPVRLSYGRDDWAGANEALKSVMVDERLTQSDPSFSLIPAEWLDFEGNFACTSDLVVTELAPGESLVQQSGWDTLGYFEMPPPTGSYTVDAAFNYMSRGLPPVGDATDAFSVDLPLQIVVDGPDVHYLSPGEALDALLADQAFQELFADASQRRWLRSDIEFSDGRWETALYLKASVTQVEPIVAIVATIDARSGVVLDVALEERTPPSGG